MSAYVEVQFLPEVRDPAGVGVASRIRRDLGVSLDAVRVVERYAIDAPLTSDQLEQARAELFTDPYTQMSAVDRRLPASFDWAVEVGFLPGVTDNVGRTAREGLEDLLSIRFAPGEAVYSSRRYLLSGPGLTRGDVERIAGLLSNELINSVFIKDRAAFEADGGMGAPLPKVRLAPDFRVDTVDLEVSDADLLKLSAEGIPESVAPDGHETRRGPLALDLTSLHVIRDYFRTQGRAPTDVELETLAQTWSEHCKHTIFAARIDEVDSFYRTYIKGATKEVRRRLGEKDFCRSVFTDNSGVVAFSEDFHVCYKVETHNSPSALDPYGGAITGIVGVNRDPLGTGMGARLALNMYGYCFGDPFWDKPLYCRGKGRKKPILHPRAIFEGVRLGVEHGGNKSGIPTPLGFIRFDDRYMGKPLVFVGTLGLIPVALPDGRPGHEKEVRPGDLIVMAGGRVGKDGIHGATFSSESLHEGSPAGAVQIGDPITQKRMGDAQQEARDLGLYRAVTDNGAGGLSSSIGETASLSDGCVVDLDKVPIKYAGLRPYEIWISESQERMTYAVAPEHVEAFLDLMSRRGVEATVIGRYTDSGRCVVRMRGKPVVDMDLAFMHDGLPLKRLHTRPTPPPPEPPAVVPPADLDAELRALLGGLNIASKEYVVRQYDHEVQGGSVIKPLVGVGMDVHSPAVVLRPLLGRSEGLALSCGILPSYGDVDMYAMAACCIDTAIRNVVAVGADPDRVALLDNFCWASSDDPQRLWQLKEAARSCYDHAVAYGAPFVSGKDSMFNDFKGFDEQDNAVKISVPPTLLISSLAHVHDVARCATLDPKVPGDLVYLVGVTRDELAGGELWRRLDDLSGGALGPGRNVPRVHVDETIPRYRALAGAIRDGLAASVHSIGAGGLAVAAAEACMAGRCGLRIDLRAAPADTPLPAWKTLFSESQGRFLVTVDPTKRGAFEAALSGCDAACIGEVSAEERLIVRDAAGVPALDLEVAALRSSYTSTFAW